MARGFPIPLFGRADILSLTSLVLVDRLVSRLSRGIKVVYERSSRVGFLRESLRAAPGIGSDATWRQRKENGAAGAERNVYGRTAKHLHAGCESVGQLKNELIA